MTQLRHPVIVFTYVCDTCGLEVGPYNYGHKNIECENCGDGLLTPVRGKGFMTTEEWENIEPTVIRLGRILGKRKCHRFRQCEKCTGGSGRTPFTDEMCSKCEGVGTMKVCPQCLKDKPASLTYFGPNLCSQYGLNYTCRDCTNTKDRNRRAIKEST